MYQVTKLLDKDLWGVTSHDGATQIICPSQSIARELFATIARLSDCTVTSSGSLKAQVMIWYDPRDAGQTALQDIPDLVDEIWVPSKSAMSALTFERPIYVVPPAVTVPEDVLFPRSDFDVMGQRTLFLAVLDGLDPQGQQKISWAVTAFRDAFPNRADVEFIILLRHPPTERGCLAKISELNHSDHRIWFWDTPLSGQENAGLFKTADAFVSLHCDNCFGHDIARSMRLGTAVIATAAGGSLDYTNEYNSIGVPLTGPVGKQSPDPVASVEALKAVADTPYIKNSITAAASEIDFTERHQHAVKQRLLFRKRQRSSTHRSPTPC
jgi:glycosyltransferase involved in cell wall biosynthesis